MNLAKDIEKRKEFHLSIHQIENVEDYDSFIENHCVIKELHLSSKIKPIGFDVNFYDVKKRKIKIYKIEIEKQNPILFNTFKFDLILTFKKVLRNISSNIDLSYSEKIEKFQSIESFNRKYEYFHDIQDSISLAARLDYTIKTKDRGIIKILTFPGLEIDTNIYPDLIAELKSRKNFFRECIYLIKEEIERLGIYVADNPKDDNEKELRYLVYELAAGIQELGLQKLTFSQKKELESKLFIALDIKPGIRSKIITYINDRNDIKALILNKIVKRLQSKEIQ